MKTILFILKLILVAILFNACGSSKSTLTKEEAYGHLYTERPMAIAIMPPINKTNNVEAKEFFYYTLSQPIAEMGYYTLPPFLCMELFKTESAYESEMFIKGDLKRFGDILGADAVLFTTINKWEKAAALSKTTVEVEYSIKSTKTNEELYYRKGNIVYDSSGNVSGGGLLGALVDVAVSAIKTASTDHIKVARACNANTLNDLPAGKYSLEFDKDRKLLAGEKEFSLKVK